MHAAFTRFIAALMVALTSVTISAQSLTFTKDSNVAVDDISSYDFYHQFTYTWGDGNTSYITDEATDPEQIMALLAGIYTTRAIPGIKQIVDSLDENKNPVKYHTVDYAFTAKNQNLYNNWGISQEDYTPDYHGLTAFVVKLKDDFTGFNQDLINSVSSTDIITNYVKSVQLITERAYVSGNGNPGYIYNCAGYYNKYFVISKGKCRQNVAKPFSGMFEEYGPGNIASGMGLIFEKDEVRTVMHDCASAIVASHFLALGEVEDLSSEYFDMCIYIPDYRLAYYDNRDEGSIDYRNYNINYRPMFFERRLSFDSATASRSDNKVEGSDKAFVYNVNLTFDAVHGSLSDQYIPQTYEIYILDEAGNETLLATTDNIQNHTYQVNQTEAPQTFTYLIKSYPEATTKYDDFSKMVSETRSVTIPGYNHESIYIEVGETSVYDERSDEEVNNYKNPIRVFNYDTDDTVYLTAEALASNPTIYIKRHLSPDCSDEGTIVAQISTSAVSTPVKADNTWTQTQPYTITNLTTNETSTGSFTYSASSESALAVARVPLDGLTIIDQFQESTKTNEQPSGYYYQLTYTINELNENVTYTSNIEHVKVYKLNYTAVIDNTYTAEQIAGDDLTLSPSNSATITYTIENDILIKAVTLFRLTEGGNATSINQQVPSMTTPGDNATRTDNGDGTVTYTITDDLSSLTNASSSGLLDFRYVIVISTTNSETTINSKSTNTYGTIRTPKSLPRVAFTNLQLGHNTHDHDGKYHFVGHKYWESTLGEGLTLTDISQYRIWRNIYNEGYTQISLTTPTDSYEILDDTDVLSPYHKDSFLGPKDLTAVASYIVRSYSYDEKTGRYLIAQDVIDSNADIITTEQTELTQSDRQLRVYPNPATATTTIYATGSIRIYNSTGALIDIIDDNSDCRTIDISSYPAGYYIIINHTYSEPLIKY